MPEGAGTRDPDQGRSLPACQRLPEAQDWQESAMNALKTKMGAREAQERTAFQSRGRSQAHAGQCLLLRPAEMPRKVQVENWLMQLGSRPSYSLQEVKNT